MKILLLLLLSSLSASIDSNSRQASAIKYLQDHLRLRNAAVLCNFSRSDKEFYRELMKTGTRTLAVNLNHYRHAHELETHVLLCADDMSEGDFLDIFNATNRFESSRNGHVWVVLHSAENVFVPDLISKTGNGIDLDIDQEVYFFNQGSLELKEFYRVNGIPMLNTVYRYKELADGSVTIRENQPRTSYLKRRQDLEGVLLKVVVEDQTPYIDFKEYPVPPRPFDPDEPEVYPIDVFNATSGMFIDILHLLGKELNFSTTLFRRYDEVWGGVKVSVVLIVERVRKQHILACFNDLACL